MENTNININNKNLHSSSYNFTKNIVNNNEHRNNNQITKDQILMSKEKNITILAYIMIHL